jgi:hypothetical protein
MHRGTQAPVRIALSAAVLSLAVVALVATLGAAGAGAVTRTFKPVKETRHALVFAPRSVRADEVRAARVRLRGGHASANKVRTVPTAKVRRSLERRRNLRVKKPRRAHGRLKINVRVGHASTTPTGPPTPVPATWNRQASFETDLATGLDGWRVDSPFEVTRTSEAGGAEGSYAVKIVTNGGDVASGCSCPRMKYESGFSYRPGASVWISGSWRIPNPNQVSWSRLMNLGHYEGVTGQDWYLALESTKPGTMEVAWSAYGNPRSTILPPRQIPVNRWFRVDLHFVLSPTDGQALTEWYLDGRLVGSTTKANMYRQTPLHFYNAGLPFFLPANGNTTVYFDAPRLTSP